MTENPIVARNVTRSFDGVDAVRNLNLAVKPGSIYGFLGRNGSGKTTTLRMLAGLIRPHQGEVLIDGHDPFTMTAAEREWFGYMSEKPAIPYFVKIAHVLQLGRELYPRWDSALADSLLTRFGLAPKKRFSTLSQGGQRLLNFIMAIAPHPRVLLLDEPAANLDVVARREILDVVLDLTRDDGCTVLFSTHILSDVERVADEIGILAGGSLRISEPLDVLKDSVRQIRFFGFRNGPPTEVIPDSYRTVRTREELMVTLKNDSPALASAWAQRWSCQYEARPLSLEDIFVELSTNS